MDTASPAPGDAPAPGVRRRDLVVGGLAGLAGLGAGGAGGRALARAPSAPPAAESELDADRKAAAKVSFAQFGEDLVIVGLLAAAGGGAKPSYLDVGAYEPILSNNTFLLYERGGRGVLVEPNAALTDKLRRLRPDDVTLVAGIGTDDRTEADYYVLSHPELNTFDKAQVERLLQTTTHRLERTVPMPLLNINRVMADHFGGKAPDVLSIGVAGLEFAVLKTLDVARFRPKIVCAETLVSGTAKHNPDTRTLMEAKGYELRGMTYPNMLFVDKKPTG